VPWNSPVPLMQSGLLAVQFSSFRALSAKPCSEKRPASAVLSEMSQASARRRFLRATLTMKLLQCHECVNPVQTVPQ